MISEETFFLLYDLLYAFLAIATILIAIENTWRPQNNKIVEAISKKLVLIFGVLAFILVGFRSIGVGTDTGNYYQYTWLSEKTISFDSEFLFVLLTKGLKNIGATYQIFLIIVSALFFISLLKAYNLISKNYRMHNIYLFFSFLSLIILSQNLAINIIRQGLSLSFLTLAYAYKQEEHKKNSWLFVILSVITHFTSLIPILIFIIVSNLKKVPLIYFVLLFILGITISYLNFGLMDIPILKDILASTDDKRLMYLQEEISTYKVGFRPNFALFNTIFLIISLYLRRAYKNIYYYEELIKYFCVSSFVFFMAFQIPFSDRLGLFSWMSIPLLLIPAFKTRTKNSSARLGIIFFLIFTYLFFNVFYYE